MAAPAGKASIGANEHAGGGTLESPIARLGSGADFSADRRLIVLSVLAIPVGLLCAVVALILLNLIGFFTNVFYFQRFYIPDGLLLPAANQLGWLSIFVPVAGGVIIGLMARYGSEKIRGHGIPEAMEAILIGRSRMQPKVALLKPLSSAISIGSGGPFGAEGPIIMTGGACGSLIAQFFHMTASERKTLLVAGAAGGMSATFGTPVAAVMLAVELLLFEWKPRSFVPVAVASAVAALIRTYIGLEAAPLFAVDLHAHSPTTMVLLAAVAVGLLAGLASCLLTAAVYASEDAFQHLPIHWMWWPAIGGLAVGIGGYFQPRALGVGYDIIQDLLAGEYLTHALLGLMIVKGMIWAIALGSGTSGGVLAPLLIIGGCLGALESSFLPGNDKALWPLVSMAAIMGGTMRSPLTGVLFALELTYDVQLLLPLLIGSVAAHALTVLVMKRSILTEKVARRGYHISREYSVDPLERITVGDAMSAPVVTVPASLPIQRLAREYFLGRPTKRHQGYPVVGEKGELLGVVTKSNLLEEWMSVLVSGGSESDFDGIITFDLLSVEPIVAYSWESCRAAAERMAQQNVGRLLVVASDNPQQLIGLITRSDLLKARSLQIEEEFDRQQFFGVTVQQRASRANTATAIEAPSPMEPK